MDLKFRLPQKRGLSHLSFLENIFLFFQKGISIILYPNDLNEVFHSQIFNLLTAKETGLPFFLACSTPPPEFLARNKKPSKNDAVSGTCFL